MLSTLLALTWGEMDNLIGENSSNLIGSDMIFGGTLFTLLFLVFTFKLGVGLEAGIIFGTIFIVWMTGVALGANTLLSAGVATGAGIILGLILLLGLRSLPR